MTRNSTEREFSDLKSSLKSSFIAAEGLYAKFLADSQPFIA